MKAKQMRDFLQMVVTLAVSRVEQSEESCETEFNILGVTVTLHTDHGDIFQKVGADKGASFSLITNCSKE